MRTPTFDHRTTAVAATRPDGHPGQDNNVSLDFHVSVDDDLAVRDAHAWLHDDRASHAHLPGHDRQALRDTRQERHTESVEPRLRTVEHLRKERIGQPNEA